MDPNLMLQGKECYLYHDLGAQLTGSTCVFRTYAPSAHHVSLICEGNRWQELPMRSLGNGIWETVFHSAFKGMLYKYKIYTSANRSVDHADPFAFYSEKSPGNASRVWRHSDFIFTDNDWMRNQGRWRHGPVNIYEMHLGSWRRRSGLKGDYYSYSAISDLLIPYLKKHGYNYVEFLPINEHPSDGSWGYQGTGFYSPTSRYGDPDQLKALINQLHRHGIGVIIDFVSVHFAVDRYGLNHYDGTELFSRPGRSDWNSCLFNHDRGFVRSFLQSAAMCWLEHYHVDGLRMDAVSHLIYRNGRQDAGLYEPGIQFLRYMNEELKKAHPDIMLIAEDPSIYQGTTAPTFMGGLGFDYKWNMGWTYDTQQFLSRPFAHRYGSERELTFSMEYFYNEKHLMALSHDLAARTPLLQMPYGSASQKQDQIRAYLMLQYTHPGRKMQFMGNELGASSAWKYNKQLSWNLHEGAHRKSYRRFTRDLNLVYLNHPALFEKDYDRDGFSWIEKNRGDGVIVYLRMSHNEQVLVLFNFSDQPRRYAFDGWGSGWTTLMDSAWQIYGGSKPSQNRWNIGDRDVLLEPLSGILMCR